MTERSFSEMVGSPAQGRVYEQQVRTGFADCAPSGRARLDALARWLQDVAYGDVADAGLAEMAVWVVRRTRIQVLRFPRFGEVFTARTYCSGLGSMWGERRTSITREGADSPDVEAVALWVHLDPADWRPMRFGPAELELYGSQAAGRRVRARLHHPAPPGHPERRTSWTFRLAEADIAAHVNNSAYWVPLEEELLAGGGAGDGAGAAGETGVAAGGGAGGGVVGGAGAGAGPGPGPGADPPALDAEIEFREAAQPGEAKAVLADGPMRWIVGDAGVVHASIRLGD